MFLLLPPIPSFHLLELIYNQLSIDFCLPKKMFMNNRLKILSVAYVSLLVFASAAKTLDPYKVLGVEKNASQREIQKAFHKLSLQYHPDKNKNKGAQEKFAEINNAYDILSDEDKRKNYDLYGDEKGSPGFDAGNGGGQGGYTYFTSGGPGQGGFSNMGGQGGSRSFSFSFGGSGGQSAFDFGVNDIFSNFFGGGMGGGDAFGSYSSSRGSASGSRGSRGGPFGSFSSSRGSASGSRGTHNNIQAINSQLYKKEILDKGMTWLLFFYLPSMKDVQYYDPIIVEAAKPLQGAMKVGRVNCETESSFCSEMGVHSAPRIFVYSFRTSFQGSLVEYKGDLTSKDLKSFCQEHLPRFSKRIDPSVISSSNDEALPKVMLLSTKRDTPVIWRVLSGLYRKQFVFYDAEVRDVSDPKVAIWGVDALPAIVGLSANGDRHILKSGIKVKDVKSSIEDLGALLNDFGKKSKKASSRSENAGNGSGYRKVPLLTGSNFHALCGQSTPVCMFGVFRSARGRENIEQALSSVSQKSLSRLQGSMDSISYALVDASKHTSFLKAFEKSGFKSFNELLIAYKPKKQKFTAFIGRVTEEEAENFISSVLNGDAQFSKVRQKPTVM